MLCISGRARGAELRRATRQLQLQWGRLRHLAYNPELQVCPKVSVTTLVGLIGDGLIVGVTLGEAVGCTDGETEGDTVVGFTR